MKSTILFTAALFCGAPLATATPPTGAGAPYGLLALATPSGDYETLETEYEAAVAEYREKLKAADRQGRRELRANSPTKVFWPRFTALSASGEGRATLWLAENMRDNRDIRAKERGEELKPLYTSLIADDIEAEWFPDVVDSIAGNAKYLGDGTALTLLERVVETSEADGARAAALYHAATIVEEDDEKRAKGYLERIEKEFPNTLHGTAARARSATAEDSEVGKVAPAFAGRTIDGHEFALEDYRGKVVVLDFYGFW